MSPQDTQRLIKIIKQARKTVRTKEAIKATFEGAGIIDKNGNLKGPYKKIYFPV
jgi:hypothetical protein